MKQNKIHWGMKEMATHSSILAWKNPWTEEPGGLQSWVTKNWTRLRIAHSKWTCNILGSQIWPKNNRLFAAHCIYCLEKAMAPHSSTLVWKIPWMEEPGGLQSMGSLGVRHDWTTSLSPFTFMHWRRKWQPTPLFLPGESQGWGSLVCCHLWGHTELDTIEVT